MWIMYSNVKRATDFLFALVALIMLLPVFISIIVAIKMDSKGPVFFKQKRVGINKTHFCILKFRTMRMDAPSNIPTHLLESPEHYITKIGGVLRKTSMDELPQIINILFGTMSVVGPRPALWNQFDLIAERDKYNANHIKPGLTGWAQINGRDEIPVEIKAMLDGEYVKRMSFLFDMKCLLKTIVCVVKRDGIVEGHRGHGTGENLSK